MWNRTRDRTKRESGEVAVVVVVVFQLISPSGYSPLGSAPITNNRGAPTGRTEPIETNGNNSTRIMIAPLCLGKEEETEAAS